MVQSSIFSQNQLPEQFKWQILSFLRIQWPDGFKVKNRLRDWISKEEYHPVSLIIYEKDILISHAEIVWKMVEHRGVTYKTYGLSGVFTYPQFRGEGFGLRLIQEAKRYIDSQDGDIALFTSIHKGFYEQAGFILMPTAQLKVDHPEEACEHIFMLFLSEKGKKGRKDFATSPIYFGTEAW